MSTNLHCIKVAVKNLSLKVLPKKYFCNLCNTKTPYWDNSGVKEDIFLTHTIVGGGYRRSKCRVCKSIDRYRWQYYVISEYTNILTEKTTILHFAPEKVLSEKIRGNTKCNYFTGDIRKGVADYVVDITDICFEDSKFDYIIANHILEHIEDEAKAIAELKRCLKPNGKLILSFPICLDSKTFEDKSIVTPENRLKAFGQKDHVRIYGTDSIEHLKLYNLNIKTYSPKDLLTKAKIKKYGFIAEDKIFICTKE